MAYALIPLATNLSQLVQLTEVQHEQIRSFERSALASAPTIKPTGLVWNQTDDGTYGELWKRWNGSAYTNLLDPEHMQLNAGGTVALAADLAMGTHKLTGLSAGSSAGDSVRYQQVLKVNEGTGALVANLAAGGFKITGLGAPTSNGDAVRYEDRFPDQSGLFFYSESATVETDASPSTSYQVCTGGGNGNFAPRLMWLRLTGNCTDQSDGDNNGAIDKEYEIRWWFGEDVKVLETALTVGIKTMRIEVERRTTAPKGVWIRVKRTDNDERQNVGRVQVMAFAGMGSLQGG